MISVVIPTYNRANTLLRSAQSVLNQTLQDIELIIVDDCSLDDTGQIISNLEKMDSRVRSIRLEKNSGACVARNTGIEAAKGEYIAFQDSDDKWRPEKLEKQIAALEKYNADICFCRFERHNYPSKWGKYYPDLSEGIVSYSSLIRHSLASTQTIIAKHEVFHEFHFDPRLPRMQDYDWIIRAAKNYRTVFEQSVLVDVYLQKDSIMASGAKKGYATACMLIKKYRNEFAYYPELYVSLLNSAGKFHTCLGDRKGKEYYRAYKISGDKVYLLKYILCRLGLLHIYYKWKG